MPFGDAKLAVRRDRRGLRASRCLRAGCSPTHQIVAAVLASAGCVIPVGPEFDEPEPNFAPQIISTGGVAEGSEVTGAQAFRVTVADENLGDTLYVRWLIDYPPATSNTRVRETVPLVPPEGGRREREVPVFVPDCRLDTISTDLTDHRLLLAVADRPFRPPEEANNALDAVSEGGRVARAAWTFILDCNTQ